MKIRIIVACSLAFTACLPGQHRFSWQEACFKRPALPYCSGHEYFKHRKPAKDRNTAAQAAPTRDNAAADAMDWRFADPDADWLAGLNFSEMPMTPLARRIMTRLAPSSQDAQKIVDGLAGVRYLAVSARGEQFLAMIHHSAPRLNFPSLEPNWKAVSVESNLTLIGPDGAVDRALQRMKTEDPPSDLVMFALDRQGNSDFWAVGSGKLASDEALRMGMKRFALMVSMQERLTSELLFEFNGVPDMKGLRASKIAPGDPAMQGNVARVKFIVEANEIDPRFGEIAGGLFGRRLSALLAAAPHLPVRETTPADRARPVIYGLEEGPR